jgi:hypothetical protein
MFTDRLREDARRLGLRVVEIDAGRSESEVAAQVNESLGL